ncbi:hypothetical protein ACLIKE_07250 [Ferroplasma acidiphilum]|uniref:Uncharacterized protein n=1 Tax=Ferroplasma acidiphilum TaxID=74969 RepID=A0A7K4FRX0_9ARCH|nr:hypothetical protein [Ferroplasma acidiphilum]NOL61029.1 hypothetical protein [Ferroplasma acidiphilum]
MRRIRQNRGAGSSRKNNLKAPRKKNKTDMKGRRRVGSGNDGNKEPESKQVPKGYEKPSETAPRTYITQKELRLGVGLIGLVPTFNISFLKGKKTINSNENPDNN